MGNLAALSGTGSSLIDKFRSRVPPVKNPELAVQPVGNMQKAGLISQIVSGASPFGKMTNYSSTPEAGGMTNWANTLGQLAGNAGVPKAVPRRKPNMKRAQRVNPVEVPTRKLY